MEVTAVLLQQLGAQTNAALTMLKQNAETEQALVNMITQSSPSGSRGLNLDITV
jgi:hypothetical protein